MSQEGLYNLSLTLSQPPSRVLHRDTVLLFPLKYLLFVTPRWLLTLSTSFPTTRA